MAEQQLKIAIADDDTADISQSIEAICAEFPAAYWRGLEDSPLGQKYPEAFIGTLEQSGFMSPSIPEEFEGIGLPIGGTAAIARSIHANGGNAAPFVAQNALIEMLARHLNDQQKAKVLPALASGEKRIQCLAVDERDVGRDASSWQTTVKKNNRGFVINGSKRWAYYAADTDYIVVGARSEDGEMSLFLLDAKAPNDGRIEIQSIETMNNNGGAEIALENVVLDEDELIGQMGKGADCLETFDTAEAILASAAAQGDSNFFSRKGTAYANERVVFGNPIGKYQGIQFPLAKAYIESEGAHVLLQMAIAHYEVGLDAFNEAVMARHMAVQAAWETADSAFTTHGGFAFAREYDIERKWREVRAMRNAASNDLPHIAKRVLGLHGN